MNLSFCFFNSMPWRHLKSRPPTWPAPSSLADPELMVSEYQCYIDTIVEAENSDFDWVAFGEEHMNPYGLAPNPNIIAAAVAGRTKKVKIAVLGNLVPILNPVRIAEEYSMIDILSKGRLIAGLIRGVPQSYSSYNVSPNESWSRFEEGNQIILKAFREREPFEWRGKHFSFPAISLWPRPLQQPHPEIFISGGSPEAAKYAAKFRAITGVIHLNRADAIARTKQCFDAYRNAAANDGWNAGADRFLVGLQTCIAPTDEEAFELLESALDYHYGTISGLFDAEKERILATTDYGRRDGSVGVKSSSHLQPLTFLQRLDAGTILCGSPETVVQQIVTLKEQLGCGIFSLHMQVGNLSHDVVRRGLSLFKHHVRPKVLAST